MLTPTNLGVPNNRLSVHFFDEPHASRRTRNLLVFTLPLFDPGAGPWQ